MYKYMIGVSGVVVRLQKAVVTINRSTRDHPSKFRETLRPMCTETCTVQCASVNIMNEWFLILNKSSCIK